MNETVCMTIDELGKTEGNQYKRPENFENCIGKQKEKTLLKEKSQNTFASILRIKFNNETENQKNIMKT